MGKVCNRQCQIDGKLPANTLPVRRDFFMKYCKVCGLPESYHGIQFDERGICNYCNSYETHRETLENKGKR